jgi:hypothetical protein
MHTRAIIIGIDRYAGRPLTSAVRDAETFRDRLVGLGLVRAEHIVFLTDAAADRAGIGAALKDVYDNGSGLDRLYFYFSGHGLMAPADAAGSVLCTALIPADVVDLAADGYRLVNLDDLCSRLRFAGPKEQMFFIDACRDLAFGSAPGNVPSLNWPASPNPSGPANAQAALYAVSPRGQALGARDGMGVMTLHLLDSLGDDGMGVDWSDEVGHYVITMESVRNYVRAKVRGAVQNRPFWERQYMLPELVATDPPLTPIRMVADPPRRTLVVTIEPAAAAAATRVALAQRRNELAEPRWPPTRSGQAVPVQPQRYEIIAVSMAGQTIVEPRLIDVRVQSAAVVRVVPPDPGQPWSGQHAPGQPDPGQPAPRQHAAPWQPDPGQPDPGQPARGQPDPAGQATSTEVGPHGGAPPPGALLARLHAEALEANTLIEVEGLDPPYRRWTEHGRLHQEVPPGFYRIRFRLGDDVFSETELEAVAGRDLTVHPTVTPSAVLSEMLGDTGPRSDVVLSESIGPVQSAVVDTMLPIIGVKPFDRTGELFSEFTDLVPVLDPADFADRPLSVVLAVEGVRWPWPVEEVLASTSCACRRYDPGGETVVTVALRPVGSPVGRRVAVGYATAPADSFTVTVSAPHFGRIELAAASIRGRVTVVTVTLSADGVLDLRQNLLRVPGRVYPEPVPDVPYGRMLRELQLGQRLYGSGELVSTGDAVDTGTLRELLHAKWTDPVLGCMAYYAWTDAVRLGLPEGEGVARSATGNTARNLRRYFPALADTLVIAGLDQPDQADASYRQLLAADHVPILARSARELARFAREAGLPDRRVVRWVDRLGPGAAWTAAWELPAGALPDLVPGAVQ